MRRNYVQKNLSGHTNIISIKLNKYSVHKNCMVQQPKAGGVLTPKKTKKNQKKPSQFTNFGVATGFFWFFLGFFGFFWFFLVFFGIFWDDILTLNLNTKKNQKIPKKTKKKPKKTNGAHKTSFQFRMLAKAYAKKKQKKPKKTKKNQKKTSFQFRILAKTNAKKNQKKPKKTKKNQCQFGNLKKPKKTKKKQKKPMPIYRFWCSDWFFLVFFG